MRKFIVITSINYPTEAIKKFSTTKDWQVILVADLKTPKDWHCENVILLTVEEQKSLPFETVNLLPYNHYARKNLGYLYAIMQGADLLYETDDDNIPYEFWPSFYSAQLDAEVSLNGSEFANAYSYFCDAKVWPRGFPLEAIRHSQVKKTVSQRVYAPIQQGLADLDPDVDAIYRLLIGEEVKFLKCLPLFLPPGTYCPFNSQNTLWYPDAFQYLFLPAYIPSRVTDIWRSYIAQHFVHRRNQGILFCSASVFQLRNKHNLLHDFEEEVQLYTKTSKLNQALQNYTENFEDVMKHLLLHNFFDERDVALFDAWVKDLRHLGLEVL
jgi:hypothetical protein